MIDLAKQNGDDCAYPADFNGDQTCPSWGLSKREHFAGLAMAATIAADINNQLPIAEVVESAVEMADALLKELDK